MSMPHFSVTYNPTDVYQVVADLFYSFWPLIAMVIGALLAIMVLGGIVWIFKRWIFE